MWRVPFWGGGLRGVVRGWYRPGGRDPDAHAVPTAGPPAGRRGEGPAGAEERELGRSYIGVASACSRTVFTARLTRRRAASAVMPRSSPTSR